MAEQLKENTENKNGLGVVDSGAFTDSLKRNFKQIKSDRAEAISEDAEIAYKRQVEDIMIQIKKRLRFRNGLLDLSPDSTTKIISANDFDGNVFTDEDVKASMDLRNLIIKYNVIASRYNRLFDGNIQLLK